MANRHCLDKVLMVGVGAARQAACDSCDCEHLDGCSKGVLHWHEEIQQNNIMDSQNVNQHPQVKIQSSHICDYCIENGFCGKTPSLDCFDGIELSIVR